MISCKDLTQIFAESDDVSTRSRPFFERVEIKGHLMICENCRHYVNQLKMIAESLKKGLNEPDDFSDSELTKLVEEVKKKLVG